MKYSVTKEVDKELKLMDVSELHRRRERGIAKNNVEKGECLRVAGYSSGGDRKGRRLVRREEGIRRGRSRGEGKKVDKGAGLRMHGNIWEKNIESEEEEVGKRARLKGREGHVRDRVE